MSAPTQAKLNDLATQLEELAKLLRKPGAQAIRLAADWEGMIAATSSEPGSRSTEHNDLSRRVLRPPAEFVNAHPRILANLTALRVVEPLVVDLSFCQRVERTKREEANRLDRLNSRSGECELCFEAGDPDSFQRGTLEAIRLETTTTVDGQTGEHDQIDVCHNCSVSGRTSRAAATKRGQKWDHNAWRRERVARRRLDIGGDAA